MLSPGGVSGSQATNEPAPQLPGSRPSTLLSGCPHLTEPPKNEEELISQSKSCVGCGIHCAARRWVGIRSETKAVTRPAAASSALIFKGQPRRQGEWPGSTFGARVDISSSSVQKKESKTPIRVFFALFKLHGEKTGGC